MLRRTVTRLLVPLIALSVGGCKSDEPKAEPDPQPEQPHLAPGEACDPNVERVNDPVGDSEGDELPPICAPGLACESLADADGYVCGAALELHGRVTDALSGAAIEGALVTALNEVGEPVTDVVTTDACGEYVLPVHVRRLPDGTFAEALQWNLTVSARDHQPFPAGLRPALPIDMADAIPDPDGPPTDATGGSETGGETGEMSYVGDIIDNAATSVALIPLGADAQGVAISGTVAGEGTAGTLVVAEGGPVPAPYAITDASGVYTIFNVPAGMVTLRGYRGGLEVEPGSVMVGDADVTAVDLAVVSNDPAAFGQVGGSLNIVNAPGGTATSVVLTPASVFNAMLERGPVPLGLRTPRAPMAPNVSSDFEIPAVPSGTYKVLVAFENDFLVRDPDAGIAGTAIQEVTLAFGESATAPDGFKVTEALAVVGPGVDGPEVVDATPTLSWADDSSEDGYDLVVFDALGDIAWMTEVPGASGGGNVEAMYAGDPLTSGMYYQFRVTSWREQPSGRLYISRTEDLRGVFVHGEAPPTPECVPPEAGADSTGTGG